MHAQFYTSSCLYRYGDFVFQVCEGMNFICQKAKTIRGWILTPLRLVVKNPETDELSLVSLSEKSCQKGGRNRLPPAEASLRISRREACSLLPSLREHSTAHGTTLMYQEVVGRAHLPPRMPTRITVMSDSEGSPQWDDRHHRRSRFRSPVSPEWAGETPAEREERRLAEAVVPVRPPAGQPRAASADTGPSTQEAEPAEVTTRAAQAASPAAPPREGTPDARGAETAAPASHAAPPTKAPGAPLTRGVALAKERGALLRAAAAAEGSGEGSRGVATAAPVSPATASAGHAAAPSTPQTRGTDPARAMGASPAAAAAAAVGREGTKYRAHTNLTHTNTSLSKPVPPKPFPPGRTRHIRPPAPEHSLPGVMLPQMQRQRDARRVIQEGGDGAQAGQRARHGSAERGTGGDRGSAQGNAQGAGQGTCGNEQGRKHGRGAEASSSRGGQSAGSRRRDTGQGAVKGPGHGKGAQGREQGAQAGGHGAHGAGQGTVGERGRSQGLGHGHGKGTGAGSAGQGVGDRERDPRHGQGDRGVGAGKGPKGKGKGAVGPRGQPGRGMGARRGGRKEGRGVGGGAPPQLDVQPVRCIPPGIKQMPAHHTHHHQHHHAHLYNIDPDAGELIPPQPPRPQHQPAPPAPRAEPARMASAAGGRDAAPAPQVQGPQGGPARGAWGARPVDRDWNTVPDPLGDEALPLVVEVYG